jgi:hypothetical protein
MMTRAAFISPDWQRRVRAVVVAAAEKKINDLQPASRLKGGDVGELVDTIISSWIMFRADQAVANGVKHDALVLMTGATPEPWDMGTVAAILPQLAALDIDWSKPLAAFSKDEMCCFICQALDLACRAQCARDAAQAAIGAEFSDCIHFLRH